MTRFFDNPLGQAGFGLPCVFCLGHGFARPVKDSDDPSTLPLAGNNAGAEALSNVREQGGSLAGLRTVWESHRRDAWAEDVAIYRQAVGSALKLGEAFLSDDIAREG